MKEKFKRFGIKVAMEFIAVLAAYVMTVGVAELFDTVMFSAFAISLVFTMLLVPIWNVTDLVVDKLMENNA